MKYCGKWTDSDVIKAHLQGLDVTIPDVFDCRVILNGLNESQLPGTNIGENSEVVKIQRTETPDVTTIILTGSVETVVYPFLVKDELVVASDAIMTTVYVENRDYIVDYTSGTIRRASTGSTIVSGASVYVWYVAYEVTMKDIDYRVNYDDGTIRRIGGTTIPEGAEVFVDYRTGTETVTDALIERAIIEAETFMYDRLDNPEVIENASIVSAANYYALAIICLSMAIKELKTRTATADTLSKQWRDLADLYQAKGNDAFRAHAIKGVALEAGGAIQNRAVKERTRIKTSPTLTGGTRTR